MEPTEAQTVELTEAQTERRRSRRQRRRGADRGADGGADGGAQTVEPTEAQTVELRPTVEPMAAQTVAPLAEESVLARLIAVDRDELRKSVLGQHRCCHRPPNSPAGSLSCSMRTGSMSLCRSAACETPFSGSPRTATPADKAFTSTGGVGAGIPGKRGQAGQAFADGSTLVLQALHRVWPPVLQFCQELAGELGHPVQANAYVTPPQNQGFSAHYDVHDVFRSADCRREAMADTSACAGIRYAISLGTTARLMWRNGPRNLP